MSAIIKTLKTKTDETEQSVYPKTVLEAVVDAETNQTLDVILDNLTVGTQSGNAYVDFNEQAGEVTGEVEKVTSASLVDYDNSTSGVAGSNVQEAIDELSNGKVNTSDIVDNLESNRADLPLSAKQGTAIAEAITEISTDLNRWNIAQGTNATIFYNRTHLRLRIARDGFSLEADTQDRTTFALPANIKAKEELFFQGLALTTSWHPTSVVVFGIILNGTNQITIKASGKLTNNVLITEVMFPRNCFTIE